MKANLALTLVGAALISLPAMAQTSTPPADTAPKATTTTTTTASSTPRYEMKAGEWRATKLSGVAVYNNNNERIGDVNEIILGRDGKAQAVVIGVGGFLGMGEHLAAVPWDKVKWMDQPRDQNVSTRTTTTTGSGTTTAPADRPATTTVERTDRPAGTTTVERTDRPATTTTTAARDPHRGYPDHVVVDMTKDQLKALPEVKYAR